MSYKCSIAELAQLERHESVSSAARSVLEKYFVVQLVNVYAANLLSGLVLQTLQAWLHAPDTIVSSLGDAVPRGLQSWMIQIS
jgi:hypothetical protein